MALPAYSTLLWELKPPYGLGNIAGPVVPAGRVWIVRQVTATVPTNAAPGSGVLGLVFLADSQPLWRTPVNGTLGGEIYEATDVRFVIGAGSQLKAFSNGAEWFLRVSGYDLSA